MKKIGIILLSLLALSCSSQKTEGTKPADSPLAQNHDQKNLDNSSEQNSSSGQTSPNSSNQTLTESPYNENIHIFKNQFSLDFYYMEVLKSEFKDGKEFAEVRFFTEEPIYKCSDYALPWPGNRRFLYMSAKLEMIIGKQEIDNIIVGSRNYPNTQSSFDYNNNVGTIFIAKRTNENLGGWASIRVEEGSTIQGNFLATFCEKNDSK